MAAVLAVLAVLDSSGGSDSPGRSTSSPYTPTGSLVEILPGEPSGPVEAIVAVSDREGPSAEQVLVRTIIGEDGSGDAIAWSTERFAFDASLKATMFGDALFVAVDRQIWNLSLSSGEQQWSAELPDVVDRACPECVTFVDGMVVVRSVDGTLTAFSPNSAEPRWSRQLESDQASSVVVGDHLVVLDDGTDGTGRVLVAITPSTGAEVDIAVPDCEVPDAGGAQVVDSNDLIAVPGSQSDIVVRSGPGGRCLTRIDTATGDQAWTSGGLRSSARAVAPPIASGEDLILALSPGPMVHVDLVSGGTVELEGLDDQTVVPAAVVDGRLLAETVTTRGTPRTGVAAWDLSTVRRSWAIEAPGEAAPASSQFGPVAIERDGPRALLHTEGDAPLLVSFDGETQQVRVSPIDIETGDIGTPSERPFTVRYENTAQPSLQVSETGSERIVVVLADLMQVVPLPDGDLLTWPPRD